ncbi:hypothetical protein D9M69_579980 [compost metagenome]
MRNGVRRLQRADRVRQVGQLLGVDRLQGTRPFGVVHVDFAQQRHVHAAPARVLFRAQLGHAADGIARVVHHVHALLADDGIDDLLQQVLVIAAPGPDDDVFPGGVRHAWHPAEGGSQGQAGGRLDEATASQVFLLHNDLVSKGN